MRKMLRKIRLFFKLFKRNHHCNLPYPEFYYERDWQCWKCKQVWYKKTDRKNNQYFIKTK